ncbi:hypothetical protein ACIQ6R_06205 [Streptomyces sp. NPDC096048]|uniref:hypothetical protein n=1 Tax=Streptomyces sp. NPDC096048 TaxID=3366072 RepID=UPI00382083B5
MADPIERALAELRAVPMRDTTTPEPEASTCPIGCTGDDRGYQRHQRTGNLPACEPALEAHRVFTREYLREWRKRRPDYHRRWRAQQQTKGGAA